MNSLKKGEGVPLLNFVGSPGTPLLNFEVSPGVPLLNFEGVPGSWSHFYTMPWSFVSYQNTCIFIKWQHVKYHAERSKYPFHLVVEIFNFEPEVKVLVSQKKFTPGWISLRLRITWLLDLDLKRAWITLLKLDWF